MRFQYDIISKLFCKKQIIIITKFADM